jgi:3-hydroxyisobutyrate dehydrogenase-like beta-hydroxyacid dehydrogenase
VLDSFEDVVRRSDVVLSVVLPSAADEVASEFCAAAHLSPSDCIYVEANSVSPATALDIGRRVEDAGRSFVDASFNGLAKNVAASGTLFLSGTRAAEVAEVFAGVMRVQLLGDEPGRASAMKMLLGGLSKGLCALFTELAVLASRMEMLDEMLEASRRTYGGVSSVVERMLPTYARHAGRRLTEMSELESTMGAAGITPRVMQGVVRLHEALADTFQSDAEGPCGSDVAPLIRFLTDRLEKSETL